MILDYLPVVDLVHFALTARRMKEMVYDDTRWVQRLKSMGCWSDTEARQRVEEAMQRRTEAQRSRDAEEARRTGATLPGSVNGIAGGGHTARKPSTTLFDAGWEQERSRRSLERTGNRPPQNTSDSGFEAATMVSNGPAGGSQTGSVRDPVAALKVLAKVRSVRGHAREEYGKIYGALAPYYFDLARAKSHTDPILFRSYRDPEQQAQMLSQLKTFAKSDWADGWRMREEKLDSMIGIFENAVLREFEQGMDDRDIDGRMRRYGHVLVTLNGGAAGIDLFIQHHPLMTQKEILGHALDCLPGGSHGILLLHPAQEFFRKLASSVNEQTNVIDRVFPHNIDVLAPFIERLADDLVSEYVTTLFDEAHDGNVESYLNAVSGVFESALRFAISLTPSKASKPSFADDVNAIIARCFEQHVDLYMQEELRYFMMKSESEVGAWEKRLSEQAASAESFYMSNVSRQAAKQDFLSSFKKVVMLPVNALAVPFSTATAPKPVAAAVNGDALAPGSRVSTPVPLERAGTPKNEAPTNELAAKTAIMNSRLEGIKSLFSIEVALNLIHTAKSSLDRMALFVRLGGQSGEEAREQCEAIFVSLLQIMGPRHIQSGFDQAVNHLSAYNPREISEHGQAGVEPLVTFLELVNVGDLIQQMVDVFYAQELVTAKLSDPDDFLSPAVKEKKRFESILDERVAAGLNKGIDVLMDEVEYICATTQVPTDFNPSTMVVDIGPSDTAKRVIEIVSGHTGMLVGSTEKNMLDVFNQEVGLRLFTVVCKHLKRQRISVDGAIKLISDTNHYKTFIRTFRNKSLNEYFDALSEMMQIYLVDPSHAKDIGKIIADPDRYHGIFRAEEVYEFAERRADWFTVKRDVERAMYGMGCAVM
jgi:recyclin-1